MDNALPPGWETKTDPQSGRVYYYNRDTKQTSWDDPRVSPPPPPPPQAQPPAQSQPAAQLPMGRFPFKPYSAEAFLVQPGMQPNMMQSNTMMMMQPMPTNVEKAPALPPVSGVPSGLEHFALLESLHIKRAFQLLEILPKNSYIIMNSAMQQIYSANEESSFFSRCCVGSPRSFKMMIADNTGKDVITIDRPYNCSTPYLPCCLPLNFCMLQKMKVMSPATGEVFGAIKQNWGLGAPTFDLEDANGELIGLLGAPCCAWSCGENIDFPIQKNGQEQAMIVHKYGGLLKVFVNADDFEITFPAGMPVEHKIVVMSAAILMDYVYFERRKKRAGPC